MPLTVVALSVPPLTQPMHANVHNLLNAPVSILTALPRQTCLRSLVNNYPLALVPGLRHSFAKTEHQRKSKDTKPALQPQTAGCQLAQDYACTKSA